MPLEVQKHDFHRDPYVGPQPFEQKEQDLFFGREEEEQEVVSLTVAHRTLLIYAQSGAGKTSLLNTRLIPLLKKRGFTILPVARVQGQIPPGVTLDEVPNPYIFNTLIRWTRDDIDPKQLLRLSPTDFLIWRILAERAEVDRHGLQMPHADLLKKWNNLQNNLKVQDSLLPPCVAIFDQFEELFTSYPDHWRDRKRFFKQLFVAQERIPGFRVVFVMREEYIAQLAPYVQFIQENLRTRFRLERLDEDAALSAVKEPLTAENLAGPKRYFARGVAEQLVKNLLRGQLQSTSELAETATEQFVEPVILQIVCQRLWKALKPEENEITEDHLGQAGNITQALSEFYESVIRNVATAPEIGLKEGSLRILIERAFITPAGTRGMVFREREKTGGIPNSIIDVLENQFHLIRKEIRGNDQWYELIHDRFITPIQKCNQKWLPAWPEAEQARQNLDHKVADWELQGKRRDGGLLSKFELRYAQQWLDVFKRAHLDYNPNLPQLIQISQTALEDAEREKELKLQQELERTTKIAARFRFLSFALALVVFLALGACWYALDKTKQALRAEQDANHAKDNADNAQAKASRSQLIARSIAYQRDKLDLAILLDLEAYQASRSNEDEASFPRDTLLSMVESNPYLDGFLYPPVHPVNKVAFSPNGQIIALVNDKNIITLLDWHTRQARGFLHAAPSTSICCIAFSLDGKTLASVSHNLPVDHSTSASNNLPVDHSTVVTLWDVATQSQLSQRVLSSRDSSMYDLALSPGGKILVSARCEKVEATTNRCLRNELSLWSVTTGSRLFRKVLTSPLDWVTGAAFSSDGQVFASAGCGKLATGTPRCLYGEIQLWSTTTGRSLGKLHVGHTEWVTSIAFSPDGTTLALASDDRTITLLDRATGQVLGPSLVGHSAPISSLVFGPDRHILVSAGKDSTVLLWDTHARLSGHAKSVYSVAFSSDSKMLASGSEDNNILLWGVNLKQPLRKLTLSHKDPVYSIAFSPNDAILASGSCAQSGKGKNSCIGGEIQLWDVASGTPLRAPLLGHSAPVVSVAFSPTSNTLLASGSGDGTILLWHLANNPPTGQPLDSREHGSVFSIAFDLHANTLASGHEDGTILLWHLANNPPTGQPLDGREHGSVFSIAFDLHANTLASGHKDGTILLWDLASDPPTPQLLKGHAASVLSVAFSPDGKTLASGSEDKTIILWDTVAYKALGLQPLSGHFSAVNSVAFSPDGKTLASGSGDKSIILWDIDNKFESLQARICKIANRNLTKTEWQKSLENKPYNRTCRELPSEEASLDFQSPSLSTTSLRSDDMGLVLSR